MRGASRRPFVRHQLHIFQCYEIERKWHKAHERGNFLYIHTRSTNVGWRSLTEVRARLDGEGRSARDIITAVHE
jgi:hypothetical protein